MFSWPFRVYSHPCLQAAELSKGVWLYGQQNTENVISTFSTDQQMQPDGSFVSQDGTASFPNNDLSLPEMPDLQEQQSSLYTGQAFVQV